MAALTSLGHVLPIKDHTLRLINNRETASSVPLATPKNFSAAVHAVAGVMDKDEDVLFIVMTSHGEQQRLCAAISRQHVDRADAAASRLSAR